jgi:phosphomannomutase
MTEKDLSIVAPINSSLIIGLVSEEMGGKVYDCRVGPPAIIDTMLEKGAKLGFEESGKYFFSDESLWPDGLLATIKILSLMYETQLSLQELVDQLPVTTATKDKIQCETEEQKEKMMSFVYENWDEFITGETKSEVKIDGIKRYFIDDSWLLIRPSGTENYIRYFCEALTPERTEELKKQAIELLEKAKSNSI